MRMEGLLTTGPGKPQAWAADGQAAKAEAGARLEVGSREGEGARGARRGSVLRLIELNPGIKGKVRGGHLDVVSSGSHSRVWCVLAPAGICFLLPSLKRRIKKRKGNPWGWHALGLWSMG